MNTNLPIESPHSKTISGSSADKWASFTNSEDLLKYHLYEKKLTQEQLLWYTKRLQGLDTYHRVTCPERERMKILIDELVVE